MLPDDLLDDSTTDLGSCCGCGTREGVRNVMMLNMRAPVPGTGWGCVVCDLPSDGAVAVLCDACLDRPVKNVCVGFAKDDKRVSVETLSSAPFDHDPKKHADD